MKITQLILITGISLFFIACNGMTDKQKTTAQEALKALKKIDAATEVGVNKIDYSKMLIDAQASVNDAVANLPDGELKQEIKLAMESYVDAKTIWFKNNADEVLIVCPKFENEQSTDKIETVMNDWLSDTCNPEIFELTEKHQIPVTQKAINKTFPAIFKKEAVAHIWQAAKKRIDRASNLPT